jgi:hypothetical protein
MIETQIATPAPETTKTLRLRPRKFQDPLLETQTVTSPIPIYA